MMEKNIFENAYFGKPYKTRDGRKAIYWRYDGIRHKLITADNKPFQPWCENDGRDYGWNRAKGNSPFDIISEWEETIDEEKLGELAEEFANRYSVPYTQQHYDLQCGFQAGFKAKEAMV